MVLGEPVAFPLQHDRTSAERSVREGNQHVAHGRRFAGTGQGLINGPVAFPPRRAAKSPYDASADPPKFPDMEPRAILLRWQLPLKVPDQRRALHTLLTTLDAYRTAVPGLVGYYASRQSAPEEAWFTAFTEEQHAAAVIDRVGAHFPGALTRSTTDPILGEDLAWYRLRLQHVTDIALSVTEDEQTAACKRVRLALSGLPDPAVVPEHQARPELYQQVLRGPMTTAAPDAMARAISSDGTGVGFWIDFVRWPHRDKTSLSPPGHWLWNLAL